MKIWNTLVCVCIGVIRRAVLGNATFVLTTSDGDPFTLICSVSSGFVVAMAWLQNNTTEVITQFSTNCMKQPPRVGSNHNISRFTVSCNSTVHRIEFRYDSTRDLGEWQCGEYVNCNYIHPRSNVFIIDKRFSLTTSLYKTTTSGPLTIASQTSESGTVTTRKASTNDSDSDTVYIVAGALGGGVLLAVVVVVAVCIRRRRQAAHQKDGMKGKKTEASPDYQNTTTCHTVENELYRSSCDITPINEAEHQKDDFIMSDVYASVDVPATSTCTPRQQGASCDVDVDSLYAKPNKSRSLNVPQVSDLYAEVMKPKKKRQDGPNMSEDVNTGDVYAKPNKR